MVLTDTTVGISVGPLGWRANLGRGRSQASVQRQYRQTLRRALKDQHYLFRPSRTRSKGLEKGCTLYFVRPMWSNVRWLNWLMWELLERSRT